MIARAALLALFWTGGACAQMYKCVDAHGVTHYADKPTPGCTNAAVDIRASPPISGRLAPPTSDPAQEEADFRRRQLERSQAEQAERDQRAALERRCAGLRRQQATLGSGRRIAQINAQGEQVFMDDEVRARRLAEVQAQLAQCP
ncbi:MAG TPA: DUF4124 domain-containing protein [Burkholderiales bacterium]|nr:DUF4124 domain-containing protein [Burkholderiales bacterium]